MVVQGAQIGVACSPSGTNCINKFGCPNNICPDFVIKRHDTQPNISVAVADCNGPLDLSDPNLVVEVNMWANGKLKKAISTSDTYFGLCDNIGFDQIMVNDIIIMDRVRLPEHMLVTGFDETHKLVQVQRGYHGTTVSAWPRGSTMKIFRTLNGSAEIQSVLQDIVQPDGTTLTNQLTNTFLVYQWQPSDTCTPGCFWLEFKLLQMTGMSYEFAETPSCSPSFVPSFTPSNYTPDDFGCGIGSGVVWVRRFPVDADGFLVKIVDTATVDFLT